MFIQTFREGRLKCILDCTVFRLSGPSAARLWSFPNATLPLPKCITRPSEDSSAWVPLRKFLMGLCFTGYKVVTTGRDICVKDGGQILQSLPSPGTSPPNILLVWNVLVQEACLFKTVASVSCCCCWNTSTNLFDINITDSSMYNWRHWSSMDGVRMRTQIKCPSRYPLPWVLGLAWLAWLGLAWLGLVWFGLVWLSWVLQCSLDWPQIHDPPASASQFLE
jgi:hypothetical protein